MARAVLGYVSGGSYIMMDLNKKNRYTKIDQRYGLEEDDDSLYSNYEWELKDQDIVTVREYLSFASDDTEPILLETGFVCGSGEIISSGLEDVGFKDYSSSNGEIVFCLRKKKKDGTLSAESRPRSAGRIEIDIENGTESCKVYLVTTPSIGKENYCNILDDLKRISIWMLFCSQNNDFGIREEGDTISAEILVLKQRLHALTKIINSLNEDPQSIMVSQPAKLPFRNVKRIDAKIILDHYILDKPVVRASVHKKSFNIYENAQLKHYLLMLLQEIKILKNRKADRNREKDIFRFKNESKELDDLRYNFEKLLKSEMFRDVKTTEKGLHSTNLFINHPHYYDAFRLMKSDEGLESVVIGEYKYRAVKKTTEIYEIWSFFKILKILISFGYKICGYKAPNGEKYKMNDNNFTPCSPEMAIDHIRAVIANSDKEEALYNLMYKLEKDDVTLYIGYNYYFPKPAGKDTEKGLRPDILIVKVKDNEAKVYIFDAKYQDYRVEGQGFAEWYKQMTECAAYKYVYKLGERVEYIKKNIDGDNGWNVSIQSSCLIHPEFDDKQMAEGYIPDYNWGIFVDYGKINEIIDRYSGRIEKDGDFTDMMKQKDPDNIFRNKLGSFAFWPDSYSKIECRIYDMLK